MKSPKLSAIKLSPQVAAPVVVLCILSMVGFEWHSLDALDHPRPDKVSCIGCHSDKKTLQAMADKAGDPLYLVHSGQVTRAELDRLLNRPEATVTKRSARSH